MVFQAFGLMEVEQKQGMDPFTKLDCMAKDMKVKFLEGHLLSLPSRNL